MRLLQQIPLIMQQGSVVRVRAPVKINLALHILGQRADGYHRLESLVVFSPDGDMVEIEPADCDSFSISGSFAASLDNGRDNLVIKARDAFRAMGGGRMADGDTIMPVAIRLTKNLPVASGLGGGSGDAAATLAGLQALMPIVHEEKGHGQETEGAGAEGIGAEAGGRLLPHSSLQQCARRLGADVPMCLAALYQQSALLVRGIGEEMEVLPDFPALHLVLLNPGVELATADVFSALAKRQNPPLVFAKDAMFSFDALVQTLHNARNDLYQPACHKAPVLADMLHLLIKSGAVLARMSGSGASCFGLYRSFAQAQKAAQEIADRHRAWFVLATTTFGSSETFGTFGKERDQ